MRALGMLLYYSGLSYEKAGMFAGASYEAVREWYQKGKELFEESIEKKRRKWIAVDEKEIKINGVTIFIWGAVDIDDEKVLAVWVSFGRSGLEAKAFLKKVRDTCKGRLPRIFIDGGPWYHWALLVVGFKDIQLYLLDQEVQSSDYSAILNAELDSSGTALLESIAGKVWNDG